MSISGQFIVVKPKNIPTDMIVNFPIWAGDPPKIIGLPGTIWTADRLSSYSDVAVEADHIGYLPFFGESHQWAGAKAESFDAFMWDMFHALLFRICCFKKVDNYTFLTLYDFLDRFHERFSCDLTADVVRWLRVPSTWMPYLRYRVMAAFVAWVFAQRMGFSSFYDRMDFFLGTLLSDIGHFLAFPTLSAAASEKPTTWFYDPAHPQKSLQMLSAIEDVGLTVRQMIERHHECVDGSGFPSGVHGAAAVPEHAQMVGLATELMFEMVVTHGGKNHSDSVQIFQNRLLKTRGRYSADVFAHFMEVMHVLF